MAWIICKYGSGGGGGERPDGSTVTPVSDVPTWLRCGGLGSKGYTTLSQVLADVDTLNGLISDANAVNYLVRSTSWISDITGNQSAMTYIGANDYAAYKLTANSTWNAAICNSSYYESVLNVKVPIMTGSTTPSGEVIESAHSGSYYGWKAFDGVVGNTSDMWYGAGIPSTLGYIFPSNVKVLKWERRNRYSTDSSAVYSPINFELWGLPSTDATWRLINSYSVNDNTSSKLFSYILDNSSSYKGYKIYITSYNAGGSSYNACAISNLQFYGRTFGNVQSWLKAGKVDKNYTTLEQVLADSSTLQALMASSDAVDYLRACGNWANTICANQSAMNYIGLNNYAANTLLSDNTWLNAIANSQYIDSVLNVKVPTMTGYTTPSGEVIYTSTSGSDYPWRAFNPSIKSGRYVNANAEGYIGYIFPNPTKVFVADLHIHSGYYHKEMKLQTSSDGGNWIDCTGYINCPVNSNVKITNNESTLNRYWRVYGRLPQGGQQYVYMSFMNFYGRQDV